MPTANLRYHRATDRITPTWSVATSYSTAAVRTGYGTTQLSDSDPSSPCWVDQNLVQFNGDFTTPTLVSSVYIVGHNYSSSADLRFRMYSSSTLGTTSPQVEIAVTVPTPYGDGFTYDLNVDLTVSYPSSSQRFFRYMSVRNEAVNGATVAIGEIVAYPSRRTFTRPIKLGTLSQPRARITSSVSSKRGVLTVHDYGSVERSIVATVEANVQDFQDLRALEANAHCGVKPFVVVPVADDTTILQRAEPMYVRIASPIAGSVPQYDDLVPVRLELRELGKGEVIGA